MTDPAVLTEMVAHHHIRHCLAAVARGEDRRDADILRGCFWADASVDFGIFAGSFDAYLDWVVPGADSIPCTLHTLGQSLIQLRGQAATAETHVTAYHRIDFGEAEHDVLLVGRYLDTLEARDGVWRIARRTMLYDWTRDLGVAVDWSQGLMGMPFLRGLPVGRARGDRSEIFFG
ncbi:nuclear transport factor 2 family protein [Sphingomonas ginsenosidivorax]|uniref:Nuclear transport factor 2 family protein n=1 Tax=Sphingomonas ginsenosidivorax TaxID=862135 RepID=A0A5C6UC54_9SPHN|nr:nuclear transport factor 2 family protein [Sphingomonas ginsenosidivorax]TXC70282.1 nuclear transport factor 2 family protein [Sphingomonas ginsenosidivorax]